MELERASKIKVKRRPASGSFVLKRLLNLTRSRMLVIDHNCSWWVSLTLVLSVYCYQNLMNAIN